MGKVAYIFPGQGTQRVGMGKDLCDNFHQSKKTFDEVDEALKFSLSKACFFGTDDNLSLTTNTQPAILAVSVAAFRAMEENNFPKPDFVAGHSLGEYSALVAANALNLSDASRIVRKRGIYMQDAVPVGVGAMAAIIGLSLADVKNGCQESAQGQVCSPANINSPKQIVIAGNSEAVDRACEILKKKGARRTLKLNVSAPFHCELMEPAQERLANDLEKINFEDLEFPIVENVSAKENKKAERICDALTEQVSSPVLWLQTVEYLIEKGVDTFIEVGVGEILSGLVRQINRDVRSLNVEDSSSLASTLNNL